MTTAKPESHLQRRIQKALRVAFPKCYVRKIHVSEFAVAGMPDLICCVEGLFIGIEVKMPGEQPSLLQEYEMSNITAAGGVAFVAESPEQAVQGIRNVLADEVFRCG